MDEKEIEENYDGFYFIQGDEPGQMKIAFFRFKDETLVGEPIESTKVGNKYHVAFFNEDENGTPKFDETFEAIFADPKVYIQNLAGANLYGCILRKTNKSGKWWDDYLKKTMEACTMASVQLKEGNS